MQLRNAQIESTMLGFEDHGILTAMIHLSYGQSGSQAFGGFGLGPTVSHLDWGDGYGTTFLATVLDVVGVDKWEQLPGKHIRVIQEHTNVHAIGNILTNKWFYPSKDKDPEVEKIINDLDKLF